MKRNRFLAVLLCGCLLSGSISSNTYASVLSECNNETVMEEAAENETETEVYIEKDITEESESEFDEVLSEEEIQTKTDVAEYESETESEIKTEIKSDEETVQEDVTQEETVQETKTSEETEIDEEATTDVEETETIEDVTTEDEILTDMQTDEADMPLKGVNADGSVTINEANFPDSAFRKYVSDEIDKNNDGVLSKTEIEGTIEIIIYGNDSQDKINSLKGIQYFENLQKLYICKHNIEELDLSNCTKLEALHCYYNKISTLDISKNINLSSLNCSYNSLSKLDISKNINLSSLSCGYNKISKLDISKNINLRNLSFINNKISKLDISKNINLSSLNCSYNSLSKLDISKNANLVDLDCSGNSITALDLSENTKLEMIFCSDNKLSELDMSNNTSLLLLLCNNNNISKLNTNKNVVLKFLDCSYNKLSKLDVSGNTNLYELTCIGNNLSEIDVSKNILLGELHCGDNKISRVDLSKNIALKYFGCSDNNMSEVDVSKNIALEYLKCNNSNLSEIDLSKNIALEYLFLNENKLTEIDVSKNKKLKRLECERNKLSTIDLSKNVELENLYCYKNNLSEIDLSKNKKLDQLSCWENPIEKLNLKNNTNKVSVFVLPSDRYITIYCSFNTWVESYCKENKIFYIASELEEESDTEESSTEVSSEEESSSTETSSEEESSSTETSSEEESSSTETSSEEESSSTETSSEEESSSTEISSEEESSSTESSSEEESEEEEKPAELISIKSVVIKCENTYLKVKKNNAPQVPKLTSVKLDGKTLKKNRDFTVSYTFEGRGVEKLTVCGKYTMTITGKGKYTGSKSIAITVTENTLISKAKVQLNSVEYTGKPITSGVIKSVKLNGVSLEEGKDYTVSYKNNVNSGKGTVIITAKDSSDYAGIVEKNFNIKGIKMSNIKVSKIVSLPYNVKGETVHNPLNITLKYKEEILELGKDYTISYENNNRAGNAKIVFTGIGKYNGTLKKSFKITKLSLADAALDTYQITVTYEKAGAKPDVKLTYNGVKLVNGKDYKLSYKNSKKITTDTNKAKITIKGIGNYKGTLSKEFNIIQKSLSSTSITFKAPDVKFKKGKKTYTTKVKVYDNGVLLKENKDYKITFNKVKLVDIIGATVVVDSFVIEGIGNYKDSRTGTFNIVNK